ncbi:MAG: T9SS type A sorting domain-containing protein [Bacteroidota bacterium]|nr:T9SS type A sorting domain-containing protein [Bacteroidota bacterium]
MKNQLKFIITLVAFSGIFFIKGKSQSLESLDINNVNAGFTSSSNMFWNQINSPRFEVPKGSGKHSIFAGNLWIGGLDNNDSLHLAADRFSGSGKDFFPGPIMNSASYSSSQDNLWDRIWKVDRAMVNDHVNNFTSPAYSIPQVFIDWPAHGNVSLGQSYYLAPFFDFDLDGQYNPYQGDYPLIKGDQALFILFNDDRAAHTETGGKKLGIEVHLMAYAFDCQGDSALDHTVFLNYSIFNRSGNSYDSTYIGSWTDMDLGFLFDDYVACDVQRGSYYTYNGTSYDGTGGPMQYGANPPAQACVILKGPLQDADGTDNAVGIGPGESLNGFGFGDGIIDNESLGMSKFLYHNNSGSGFPATQDPTVANDYYHYLRGNWKDGVKMNYGGNGHNGGNGGVDCNYMFPGTSDPLGWGTGGQPQADWSEITEGNYPDDRRGMVSSGPFTIAAGSVQTFDLALIFGRDYTGTNGGSIQVMNDRTDAIRNMFFADSTPCGGNFTGVSKKENIKKDALMVYPNPANEYLTIDFLNQNQKVHYEIYDMTGRLAFKGVINSASQNIISLQGIENGMYIIKIIDNKDTYTKKFFKMSN